MRDLLLELSQRPQARNVVRSLGLPLPLPQQLKRGSGPWPQRPIDDATVVVGGRLENDALGGALAHTITEAGGDPHVIGDKAAAPFREPGEAYGRRPRIHEPGEAPEDVRADALVFDGTGLSDASSLRALYDFYHMWLGRLATCGRVVVIGRPPQAASDASGAAAQQALEGFTRTVAKEVGRRGATANLLYVESGAESRVAVPLRWLLSAHSAFVTGQPFHVTTRARDPKASPLTQPLHGKVALVTGAARGIGAATVRRLAGEGAHVVCLDRPQEDGPVSQLVRDVGGSMLLADIASEDAPRQIADQLRREHGGADIVVHNAGVTRDKTLARMKEEQWDQVLGINLDAAIRLTEALRKDVLRDEARVTCLSSVTGIAGNVGQSNYTTSKAGLIGFVRHLAPELASRGITVNAIAPGFIETQMTAAMPASVREPARRLSALGQGGDPQDVAETITMLSAPGAAGLSGEVVRVCGGQFIGA